jgi:hypothetical protein
MPARASPAGEALSHVQGESLKDRGNAGSVSWAGCTIKTNAEQFCETGSAFPGNVHSYIIVGILEIKVVRIKRNFNTSTNEFRIPFIVQDPANRRQRAITRYEPDNLRGDVGILAPQLIEGPIIHIGHP